MLAVSLQRSIIILVGQEPTYQPGGTQDLSLDI